MKAKEMLMEKSKGSDKMHKVMHEFKERSLNIGKSKKKVKNSKQAIAIGMSSKDMDKK
jgi:hypothetical protein